MVTDADGNIYVTGTTWSPDFPVKNAAQPRMGEEPPGRRSQIHSSQRL